MFNIGLDRVTRAPICLRLQQNALTLSYRSILDKERLEPEIDPFSHCPCFALNVLSRGFFSYETYYYYYHCYYH